MMQLNATKCSMMKLIRECRHRMPEPVPLAGIKERRLRRRKDGAFEISWRHSNQTYYFVLDACGDQYRLTAKIFEDERMDTMANLRVSAAQLIRLGILTDGEEGLACQG